MIQNLYLPDVGPSNNAFYSGLHWSERKKIVDHWHLLVFVWAKKYGLVPVTGPVNMDVECYFAKRRAFDSSNCSATAKLVEDGLVAAKILKGDGPKYVRWVRLRAIPRAEQTYTMVTLSDAQP